MILARQKQQVRFKAENFTLNVDMDSQAIKNYCQVSVASQQILKQATQQLQLSARAYFKLLKLSRTIADLAGRRDIKEADILEAIRYRNKIFEEV